MTNDITPAPEGVTPEAVAAILKDVTPAPWRVDGEPWNQIVWSGEENRVCFMAHSSGLNDARDIATARFIAWARNNVEALAADRDAQKARADAAEAETNKVRRFLKISRDEGGEALARAKAAEAKVVRLEAALDVDPWFLGWGAWQYHVRKARAAIAEVQTNRTTTPTEYERKVAQMKEDFPNGI